MGVLSACALVLLAYALMVAWLQLIALIVAVGRAGSEALAWQSVSSDPLNVAIATALGIGCALWLGKAWYDPNASWAGLLALRATPVRTIVLAIVCGLALQVPLTELQNVAERFFPVSPEQKQALYRMLSPNGWRKMLGALFSLAAVAPLCEELLFRGLILRGLRKSHGWFLALSVSSLLFGLCHIRLAAALFPACAAGVILGAIALRTRSTWPAIASHAAINAAPLMLSERLIPVPGFNTVQEGARHVPLPLLLVASAVAFVALAAIMRWGEGAPDIEDTKKVPG
jgi:membrane protease YdiL (CAAX protease family)